MQFALIDRRNRGGGSFKGAKWRWATHRTFSNEYSILALLLSGTSMGVNRSNINQQGFMIDSREMIFMNFATTTANPPSSLSKQNGANGGI